MEEEDGVWRTVKGRRIFIHNGEDLETAMRNSGKFNKSQNSNRKEPQKSQKSYNDWDSEEKKRFRRWYRKNAELLAKKYGGTDDEVRKKAQEEWADKHNLDDTKEPVDKAKEISERIRNQRQAVSDSTKSVSDKIKEQRERLTKESLREDSEISDDVEHDYSKGSWDADTKSFVLEDGHRIEMLKKKEYRELAQKQFENADDDTKDIVNSYTISQATAGSCDLNKITPKNIAEKYRFDAIGITTEDGLVISQRERDLMDDKMYKDWQKNYEPKVQAGASRYDLEHEWRKAWNMETQDINPRMLEPDEYWGTKDPKTGKRLIWTKEEVAEAKVLSKELNRIDKERVEAGRKYGYSSPEYEALEREHDEIASAATSERLRRPDRSAYWFEKIAKYDETMVYRRDVDIDALRKKGKFTYLNKQEQIDLEWTDDLRAKQSSEALRRIDGLKSSVKQFDDAFKKDGTVLDHDIMVYRRSYESTKEMEEGYTKLGYTSTSAQDTLPKKMPSGIHFGEQEQYIIIPKGTKVLFAEDIIGYDHMQRPDYVENGYKKADDGLRRQHEVILPRGTSFKQVGEVVQNGWNVIAHVLKAEVKEEYKDGRKK